MREEVTLNKKEQRRLMILNKLEHGDLKNREAAQLLCLSERQVKRLRSGYRVKGAKALEHGNRGREPVHALCDEIRNRIVDLVQRKYTGFNQQHFTEMLIEREGISVSRSTVRRILSNAGIHSPMRRRPPKHRKRRDRYPQEGMMLQIDGSPHDWLEERGPKLSMIAAIDDATGKVAGALFREQEDAQGYFLLLKQIVAAHGIPVALYHDRHGIFERSPLNKESIDEQLEGKRALTQFGRLMQELGVTSIAAMSPQAKGRIERLWGTFQDRLVSELRLAGVSTLDEANSMLEGFLPAHNRRFAVSPVQTGSAYRKPHARFISNEVFCFKYRRTVARDNVVRFANQRLQVFPSNGRPSYAYAHVDVHEHMDGVLSVHYQEKCLLTKPAPYEASALRARAGTRPIATQNMLITPSQKLTLEHSLPGQIVSRKPAPNHPWRHMPIIHIDRG
jgi:transposase